MGTKPKGEHIKGDSPDTRTTRPWRRSSLGLVVIDTGSSFAEARLSEIMCVWPCVAKRGAVPHDHQQLDREGSRIRLEEFRPGVNDEMAWGGSESRFGVVDKWE